MYECEKQLSNSSFLELGYAKYYYLKQLLQKQRSPKNYDYVCSVTKCL